MSLELGPEHRQRRAQLVAGVSGESALALEAGLQPREHLVDRRSEAVELVAAATERQPLVQAVGADRSCAPAHRLDRAQRGCRQAVAGERGEQQRTRAADEQQGRKVGNGLVAAGERSADDDHEAMVLGVDRHGQQSDRARRSWPASLTWSSTTRTRISGGLGYSWPSN
jgi:hypothetical protein